MKVRSITQKLPALLASNTFFWITIGFFIFEALWFVFSAVYPMAFDEDFHFGIIKIYAEQWSPFLTHHPAGADAFGAVVRDPSYFFHYLMSFPYRFVALLTNNEAIQVISLRLMNVGFFVGGLLLFRRVLTKAGTSPMLTNTAFALLALIPIAPQLAAHINYDNLLMVLVAWLCLVVFRITDSFREQRVDTRAVLTFVAICLFTSIVKYAALPLLAAAVWFLAIMAWRAFRGRGKRFLYRIKDGYMRIGTKTRVILFIVLAIGSVLFVQRYAINLVRYGGPVPDCGQVLTVEQCKQYGPWGRDHYLEQIKPADFTPNIAYFVSEWVVGMRHRLFFAVNGPRANFHNVAELPVPVWTATLIFAAGLIGMVVWWRRVLMANVYYVFFALMCGVYIAVLFAEQFSMYNQTGDVVAINGRYLLPVLLPLAALLGTGIAAGLRRYKAEKVKPYLAAATIILFLHGGGFLTFILRSDANWYWDNRVVTTLNDSARRVLAPIIIEGHR